MKSTIETILQFKIARQGDVVNFLENFAPKFKLPFCAADWVEIFDKSTNAQWENGRKSPKRLNFLVE